MIIEPVIRGYNKTSFNFQDDNVIIGKHSYSSNRKQPTFPMMQLPTYTIQETPYSFGVAYKPDKYALQAEAIIEAQDKAAYREQVAENLKYPEANNPFIKQLKSVETTTPQVPILAPALLPTKVDASTIMSPQVSPLRKELQSLSISTTPVKESKSPITEILAPPKASTTSTPSRELSPIATTITGGASSIAGSKIEENERKFGAMNVGGNTYILDKPAIPKAPPKAPPQPPKTKAKKSK
jgi:hypothetical protein